MSRSGEAYLFKEIKMANLFKVEMYIVDPNGSMDINDLKDELDYALEDSFIVYKMANSVELEWDDEHPLNQVSASIKEHEEYFK